MRNAVIVDSVRTGLAKSFRGGFNNTRADNMTAHVVNALLERNPKVDASMVEDIILGCGNPEGAQGHNIARNVAVLSNLPIETGGVTINRYCSSGLNSILIDSASKGPLIEKQIKTLSKEDLAACVEEDICIEKIIEIDPKAFILKLDYFKDPSNELFVSLIDLENKYIKVSDAIDCYDCSTIELLDKLKSFKLNDGYGSPALIKESLGFKYQQLTMPEDMVTLTISSIRLQQATPHRACTASTLFHAFTRQPKRLLRL